MKAYPRQTIRGSAIATLCLLTAGALSINTTVQAAGSPAPFFANTSWTTYDSSVNHNAIVPLSKTAPAALASGVHWKTREFHAVALNQQPLGTQAFGGSVNAAVTMTQNLGNGVGVSLWGHDVYAASSSGYIYAVNALTGQTKWRVRTLNVDMSNPLVERGTLYAGTGNVAFNFPALGTFGHSLPTVRGGGYGGIYAINARSGHIKWFHPLSGNQMPTPALSQGTLYFANGNGYFYALNANTGKTLWKLDLKGFDSMSSTTLWSNPSTKQTYAIVGTTDPNQLNAINLSTHQISWSVNIPGITLTGMGDETPAYSQTAGLLVEADSVRLQPTQTGGTVNMGVYGINPANGQMLWQDSLGRGPIPAAYRGAVAMTHNGIAYVSDTATSTLFAINAKTGQILWNSKIPNALPAGAGRGAPTYFHGVIWIATSKSIDAFNAKTGQVLRSKQVGGRFGIINPVIAGGTMYLDNSYDWIIAIPLHTILPTLPS